jgi:hypothetical protein
MWKIPLTRGLFAIVDEDDYERLMKHSWHAAKQPHNFYACRTVKVKGKKKTIWMHREINRTPEWMKTDHIDCDGLNNRKENLRSVNHADNMINGRRNSPKKPKYRGVSWHKRTNRWIAQITVDYKNQWLGSYLNPEDARDAYQAARAKIRSEKIYKE